MTNHLKRSGVGQWRSFTSRVRVLTKRTSEEHCIDTEQEDDGRSIAEVPELAGVLVYGQTRDEAQARAQVLALRVIAERLEHGEARPVDIRIYLAAA